MGNKEQIRTGFEKCLDEFDDKFYKQMQDKQKVIPILLNLFEQYEEDINTQSTLNKEMHKLQMKITNKLEEKCDREQNELIEQLTYCISAESNELIEKAFVYGFCVAQSLKEETEEYIKE